MSRTAQRRLGLAVFSALVLALIVWGVTLHPASARPAVAAAARTSSKPVRVPIEVDEDDGDTQVLVPVVLNGRRYTFVLDTGASTSAVNGTVLRAVHAADTGDAADFEDASGGTERAHLYRVHRWAVGGVPLQDDAVVSGVANPLDVDGLLGSDQLSRFGSVTIDYADGVLVLTPRRQG